MTNITWKPIPGFEFLYEVSDLGQIKSLPKYVRRRGIMLLKKEIILKHNISKKHGYHYVRLYKEQKWDFLKVHRIVLMSFVGPSSECVDHINGDRGDNRLVNLRYCTQRENIVSGLRRKGGMKSNYPGVTLHEGKYWRARILINGERKCLGHFKTEEEARIAYEDALLSSV